MGQSSIAAVFSSTVISVDHRRNRRKTKASAGDLLRPIASTLSQLNSRRDSSDVSLERR
jgi:hypothetical protein